MRLHQLLDALEAEELPVGVSGLRYPIRDELQPVTLGKVETH